MSDAYKLQYNGMTVAYPGWAGYVSYASAPSFKTLTLCASEGGTLTADTITGYPGDTVQLSTAYNTYWRFSGYDLYGDGSVSDNTYTFGSDDEQIVSAYFKPNAFTATGNFEQGSNVHCESRAAVTNNANVPAKYAVLLSYTGDVPDAWHSTSNRWCPSDASAYSMTLDPKMEFLLRNDAGGAHSHITACSLVGSTATQTAAFSRTKQGTSTHKYEKSFTTNTQDVNYGISAKLQTVGATKAWAYWSSADYIATGTTGTWTATGYAP